MKLTTRQEWFAAVTGWVAATARTGKTATLAPVLAGLLLTAEPDGTLTVAGYDYEVSARATMTCAEVGEPGRVLLSARMLAQLAASLPAGYEGVTLTTDGTRAVITAGPVTYTLLQLPDAEFPALPAPGDPVAEFGAEHLAAAVTQAVTAAGRDDTLPALTCVQVTLDGNGTATFAATDRYRLAVATCPYTPLGEHPGPFPMLIPARDLAAVTRRTDTATVTLALDSDARAEPGTGWPLPGTAAFTTADRQVTVRLTAAEFPAYAKLIPAPGDATSTFTADIAPLAEAVKRAEIVAPSKEHPVRLDISVGEARIEAGTGDDAGYAETVPVQLDGEPVHIAFKPRFLLDALGSAAAAGTGTARITITGPAKPVLVTSAESGGPVTCRHIVMPIRGTG